MLKVDKLLDAANWIDAHLGRDLNLATPLGLGKPNQLLNLIYARIKGDPSRSLKLFTALSLEVPKPESDLEKRFITPFSDRHFGKDYPELLYSIDRANNGLPSNIQVFEFYYESGTALNRPSMQHDYMSVNYTYVAQVVFEQGITALLCIIAKHPSRKGRYSLSCNPDLTLDLAELYRKNGKKFSVIGVVHPDLPYMTEDAEVDETFFELIVDSSEIQHELFALPRVPVSVSDYLIGLRASMLMPDDGTLQVGIGSLSDALVFSLLLRQQEPKLYQEITDQLILKQNSNQNHLHEFHQKSFQKGLYGTSEMIMDAFMHLHRGGILKRQIHDSDHEIRRYLHGAFFLGSKEFYRWMSTRISENDHGLCMTRVSKVNDLYDEHELAIRRQRKNARFYNMCLEITLLGGVASDTLNDGQVVSGIGGQYNFVSMSHELPDSHSVLLFRSYHLKNGKKFSNVNWGQEQLSLPRHLRDVFITEHGFSFTRGQTDEQVIRSNLELVDSEFQESLRKTAIQNGKLKHDYRIPNECTENHQNEIKNFLKPYCGYFKPFPFGSDFTPVEERLAGALAQIKSALPFKHRLAILLWRGLRIPSRRFSAELARMGLENPRHLIEKSYQCLLKAALE